MAKVIITIDDNDIDGDTLTVGTEFDPALPTDDNSDDGPPYTAAQALAVELLAHALQVCDEDDE